MDDIIDRETDQYDDSDGFRNTKLHIVPVHTSHHTDDNHDDGEDSNHTLEHISGRNQKNDECETD